MDRRLQLKGSYEGGVRPLQDPQRRQAIDQANATLIRSWLNKNTGMEFCWAISTCSVPNCYQHFLRPLHRAASRGLCARAIPTECLAMQRSLPAGGSVGGRTLCTDESRPSNSTASVVYPGVRSELFGVDRVGMPTPLMPDGSRHRPLKVCFAGLLMSSKGAHTLIEALIQLKQQGLSVQASIAGDNFQSGYREQLEQWLKQHNLDGAVQFVGQLGRQALARFYALHHVGVFLPSTRKPSGLWPQK